MSEDSCVFSSSCCKSADVGKPYVDYISYVRSFFWIDTLLQAINSLPDFTLTNCFLIIISVNILQLPVHAAVFLASGSLCTPCFNAGSKPVSHFPLIAGSVSVRPSWTAVVRVGLKHKATPFSPESSCSSQAVQQPACQGPLRCILK